MTTLIENLSVYKTNKTRRIKYFLHTCKKGGEHIWKLATPYGKKKTNIFDCYTLDGDYRFPMKLRGERVPLWFECCACTKVMLTKPKVCKHCRRAIKPVSKKMEEHTLSYLKIKCLCYYPKE